MHSHTVLCGDLYTACVDASRTVFWDRSFSNKISLAFSMRTMSYHTIIKTKTIINMKMYINITQSHLHTNETININQKMKNQLKTDRWLD